jgi:hypothetical protein
MDPKITEDTVLWRRLDTEGHESARLSVQGKSPYLEGAAVNVA